MANACPRAIFGALALALAAAGVARAQPAEKPSLSIELNALQPADSGCRLSFVATNGLDRDIDKIALEIVLFDAAGMVERMTVLDLKEVAAGKTRVRQFELAGVDCANISRILVNDAKACEGPGLDPGDCIRTLETTSKTSVPFLG